MSTQLAQLNAPKPQQHCPEKLNTTQRNSTQLVQYNATEHYSSNSTQLTQCSQHKETQHDLHNLTKLTQLTQLKGGLQFCFGKCWDFVARNRGVGGLLKFTNIKIAMLGKPVFSKIDEFSEIFRTAFVQQNNLYRK